MRKLADLAKMSGALRAGAVVKQAGLLSSVASLAAKKPVATALVGMGAVGGAKASKGKYDEHKAGFDPAVNQMMLGLPPQPPG